MATPHEDKTAARVFYRNLLDDLALAKTKGKEFYRPIRWLVEKEKKSLEEVHLLKDLPPSPPDDEPV
jgi:hypothetical protein